MSSGGRIGVPLLRPMRWWDIADVLPIEHELFGAEAWSARMLWSELAQRDSRHYVVAEADEAPEGDRREVLGYAGLAVFGDEGWVLTLGVRRSAQRLGLGSRLLEALLATSDRRGTSTVLLEVRIDNLGARALYERYGFRQIGIRKGYYQPSGTDAVVMQRG